MILHKRSHLLAALLIISISSIHLGCSNDEQSADDTNTEVDDFETDGESAEDETKTEGEMENENNESTNEDSEQTDDEETEDEDNMDNGDENAETCQGCETFPAEDIDFTAALIDSKLQSDFLTSDNKDLANLCNPEFFFYCDDKFVMKASGAADERTELRQEKDFSLSSYSDMEFEATFTEVPTTSTSKGVTIAQIHNDYEEVGRPLIRVDIINGNLVRSHINASFVKNDGSASNDDLVAFAEGDLLYVKLEISGENSQVVVYVENKTQGTDGSFTYTVDSQWDTADGEYYYKAGLYTQEGGRETVGKFDYITYTF